MNVTAKLVLLLAMIICLVDWSTATAQTPLDTDFTYQGELHDGGIPANGNYDLSFELFDAVAGGNQIGAAANVNNVPVSQGRFTVELDFGASSLNGDNRWLQIQVNGNALSPRQPVNGTPYAIQTRGIHVADDGYVGIGRTAPIGASSLDLETPAANDEYGGMYVSTTSGTGWPFYGYAAGGTFDCWTYYDGGTGDWHVNNLGNRLTVGSDGYVGIGRSMPVTGFSQFDVDVPAGSDTFGGMYVNTSGSTAWPFYGFAVAGQAKSWTYYDGGTGDWHLDNNGVRLTVRDDGFVGVGRGSQVTGSEWFGIDTPAGDHEYGGMYITTEHPSGFPFYGYAAGGTADCWTWYHGGERDWHVVNGGTNRLTVEETGHVGIGTVNPGWTLQVNGSAAKPGGGSWTNSSDVRLKKNIQKLDGALQSLMKLRGVTFEYLDPKAIHELPGERIGVIAQEVEKVFPDWIDETDTGYKGVTFRGFEALTIEALRELRNEKDQQIAKLRTQNDAEIAECDKQFEALRSDHNAAISELQQRMVELEHIVAQLASNCPEEQK